VCLSSSLDIQHIQVEDAAEKLETGWVYLDVRTEEEFAQARVPNSINIPVFVSGPSGKRTLRKMQAVVQASVLCLLQ